MDEAGFVAEVAVQKRGSGGEGMRWTCSRSIGNVEGADVLPKYEVARQRNRCWT